MGRLTDLAATIGRLSEKLEEEFETLEAKLPVEDDPAAVEELEHRVGRKRDLIGSYRRAIQDREHGRTEL